MEQLLKQPKSITWQVLQRSRNVASVSVLAEALEIDMPEVRRACLKALVERKEEDAKRAILLSWDKFDAADTELLRVDSKNLSLITSRMLEHGSSNDRRLALAAIDALDLTESIDQVAEIMLCTRSGLAPQATKCLIEMCERWGTPARHGKTNCPRRNMIVDKLNRRMVTFYEHKNSRLIDGWLSLVHWDDAPQRSLVSDPKNDVYRVMLERLTESTHPAVLQLLAGYLWRTATPQSVINILVERPEPELAVEMAKLLTKETLSVAMRRLRSLPALKCFEQWNPATHKVPWEVERKLWLLIASSSDNLSRVLSNALRLAKLGTSDARKTAAEMLLSCKQPDLEQLVPAMQASTVAIGSDQTSLASMVEEITGWLVSPSSTLKKAAQSFLRPFTLDALLDQIRHWPVQLCRTMASIVAKTERDLTTTLIRELKSPATRRRIAALQAIEMLDCASAMQESLVPLLEDPRIEVRVQVIDLLSALGEDVISGFIPALLQDASTDIQDAANRAIRKMNRQKARASSSETSSSRSQDGGD